ncbi:hypothetical protein U8527_07420 [Kordia algicida OT-1]|uniref:Outer membrane protein beta-barrel domain-containing protein n=1 Tax=Kordia algicida OT-1 TaxID=391587 RepID=A9EDJ7_9FLAO|nr:hypothetical protein [Kordia algicida]EDP94241.1 hypothetical protein KAOT1_00835 [Kordia algicida OT-1]
MKQLISLLIITLTIIGMKAQNNSDGFDPFNNATVSIGGGVFMPQGNLSTYFGTAPFFEISGNFPLKRKKAIGATLQIVIPNQKDDFLYRRTIDTIQVKSTMMVNFTLDFKKTIRSFTKGNVDLKLGIGASGITTDARNPFYSGEEGESKYEIVGAILFSPGLEYKHEFNEDTKFIIGVSMHYAPYKVEGAVRENIGGLAFVPKITYVF